MNVLVDISFEKDLRKLKDDKLLMKVFDMVNEMRAADAFTEIKSVKKLKGSNSYYRVRIGDYRMGFGYQREEIVLYRFLHRKEIYKYFP
jgi:mRNA interferase RelE/StbE